MILFKKNKYRINKNHNKYRIILNHNKYRIILNHNKYRINKNHNKFTCLKVKISKILKLLIKKFPIFKIPLKDLIHRRPSFLKNL